MNEKNTNKTYEQIVGKYQELSKDIATNYKKPKEKLEKLIGLSREVVENWSSMSPSERMSIEGLARMVKGRFDLNGEKSLYEDPSNEYQEIVRICVSGIDRILNDKMRAADRLEMIINAHSELAKNADKLSTKEATALYTFYNSLDQVYRRESERALYEKYSPEDKIE